MAGGGDPKWQKDAADQNFDYMFKLLIIGNSSVGKTSFLFRYADDSFTSAFVSTVGIDFKVKTVFRHDKRVKLQIWVSSTGKETSIYLFLFKANAISVAHSGLTCCLFRSRPALLRLSYILVLLYIIGRRKRSMCVHWDLSYWAPNYGLSSSQANFVYHKNYS